MKNTKTNQKNPNTWNFKVWYSLTKKRTVPPEVDVRDNKAVFEMVRQEALMI